jgi:hypothetical protein
MNHWDVSQTKRFGLHYYNDTLHYTNRDLVDWLPVLKGMNVSTLILKSAPTRAIPEQFISALIGAGISPIIHIPLTLPDSPAPADLKAILEAYARWGVRYVILFDKPNSNQSWTPSSWVQQGLVERFLDKFIPLAAAVVQAGMTPVFPPLEPGGSYWDTVFLKASMQSLQRRKQNALLDHLALAAYPFSFSHSLDWGKGGPGQWTKSLPYLTPEGCQDQRGFRIYEWYNATTQSTIQRTFPIFLLGAGINHDAPGGSFPPEQHFQMVSEILALLTHTEGNSLPENILSCNFLRLSASKDSPDAEFAWFDDKDHPRQTAAAILAAVENVEAQASADMITEKVVPEKPSDPDHPIQHYLLLPLYEWGIADWHLDAIRPYVKKHQPTIGFSVSEAMHAAKVTLIGGEQSFSRAVEEELVRSGCEVERISGDGTTIATLLAER